MLVKQRIYALAPAPVQSGYHRLKRLVGADVHVTVTRSEIRHVGRYVRASDLVAGRSVLDVACGSGYGALVLHSAAGYVGLDLDPRALREARREFPEFDYRQGSVYELPFEDASFGAVTSFETLEHVDQPLRAVAEITRVLEPGGVLVASIPINHPDRIHHFRPYTAVEAFEILTGDERLEVIELHVQGAFDFQPTCPSDLPQVQGGTLYGVLRKR